MNRNRTQKTSKPVIKLVSTLHDDEKWVECVMFSPDEKYIATCSGENANLWNVKLACKDATFKHNDAVWKCIFSRDSSQLFTVASDGCLYIWDVENYANLLVVKLHKDCVFGLSVHPHSNLIATCSADYTIKCFKIDTHEVASTLRGHSKSVEDVCFSPCGNVLASCSKDKTILLWTNFYEEKNLKAYSLKGHRNWVYMCKFSPDSKSLASVSSDKTVGIWSVEEPCLLRLLYGHNNVIWGCTFIQTLTSPNELYLASCSSDKTLRIWDIERGKCLFTQRNIGGVSDGSAQLLSCSFAPLSRLLAVSTYHGIVYIGKIPLKLTV